MRSVTAHVLCVLATVSALRLAPQKPPVTVVSRRTFMAAAVVLPVWPALADGESQPKLVSEMTPKEKGALRLAELKKVVRLPGGGTPDKEITECDKCITRSCIAASCPPRECKPLNLDYLK